MPDYIFNSKQVKSRRRQLRQQPILCERLLWQKIRNQQLHYKFKRQYSVGQYVVDFYCPELKLVIEIDGATHFEKEAIIKDQIREEYLLSLNLNIKHYFNDDIKNNLPAVLYNIIELCDGIKRKKNLTPNPSPLNCRGETPRELPNSNNPCYN